MIDRWHGATGARSYSVAEADDGEAIATWCNRWADFLAFHIQPVMDDEKAGRVLSS